MTSRSSPIGTDGGRVVCLSEKDGAPLWSYEQVEDGAMVYASPAVADAITVVGGGRSFVLQPARTGLGVDVERSVRGAGGFHSINPLRMLRMVTGQVDAPLVVTADDAKLSAAVATIAAALDNPPVEVTSDA